jgi:hypothetical protein
MKSGDKLRFSIRVRRVEYGDRKVFREFRILMWHKGRCVGVENGPSREHLTAASARAAGMDRIRQLQTRELYAIKVTRQNIVEGEARSCQSCAIFHALWDNKKRMGLSEYSQTFRVVPYAFMSDVDGIVLCENREEATMPDMPDLVVKGNPDWQERMQEWAMNWDNWAEKRYMGAHEWRELYGDSLPYRPAECSFVLDLTHFKEQLAKAGTA